VNGVLTRTGVPRLWDADEARLWRGMRRTLGPLLDVLAPTYAYGAERVPATGGLVLAANHFSAIDHPVLANVCPRPIAFLAKAELLELPLVGDALSWTGAFPIHRGTADRAALRRARELAAGGHVVGVHLEGTRQRADHPGLFKQGAVAFALAARVPVLPCGLDTFGWSPASRRVCVAVFGEPLALAERDVRAARAEALEVVGAEVVRLWELARGAAAAGLPPQLADGALRSGRVPPAEPAAAATRRCGRPGRPRRTRGSR
jgi:1-acyl-sn-glycerol-3-phosphate acyltransferase